MLLVLLLTIVTASYRPVVLMHGVTAGASSMEPVVEWIKKDLPGIYVKNVEIGDGSVDSLLWGMEKQVGIFIREIQADPQLKNGFNLVGYSQGSMITRAYIETSNNPPVHNYITWSGPHGGQYGVPSLPTSNPVEKLLADAMSMLEEGRWRDVAVQDLLSFAGYWKDPIHYNEYLEYVKFLPDINNEGTSKNSTYREHMISLNSVTLLMSSVDTVIIPKSSGWFESFTVGQKENVTPLKQSQQYKEDWIGLKTLDEAGKLHLEVTDCPHIDYPSDKCKKWFDLYTLPNINNTFA